MKHHFKKGGFVILASLCLFLVIKGKTGALKSESGTDLKPLIPFQGKIVFQSNLDGDNEIFLLTQEGLRQLTSNDWDDGFPVWSPDGKHIAFQANPRGNYDIFILKEDGAEINAVTDSTSDETEPAWFPDGNSLAYTRDVKKFLRTEGHLFRTDLRTKKSERIIPGFNRTHGISHVSPDGSLITFTAKRMMGWDVAAYDFQAKRVNFLEEGGDSCRGRFSKDGKSLAYVSSRADGKGDIWLMNPDGSEKRRLTERPETYDYFPSWSPDGDFVVFNSSRQHDHNGDWALYILEIKTGKTSLLFDSPGNDVFPDWSK